VSTACTTDVGTTAMDMLSRRPISHQNFPWAFRARNPRRCSPRVPSVVPCYLHFPFMTFFSSFLQHPSPTFLSYIQSERYHPCDRVPTLERPHLCNTRKPPYLFLPTKMPQRALPPPSSRPPRRGAPGWVGAEPSPDRTIDHAHAI